MSISEKSKGERGRTHELKNEVLAELLTASWMVEAGWTRKKIADHYRNNRAHRAAVAWGRRKRCPRCKRMNTVGCICP